MRVIIEWEKAVQPPGALRNAQHVELDNGNQYQAGFVFKQVVIVHASTWNTSEVKCVRECEKKKEEESKRQGHEDASASLVNISTKSRVPFIY